MTTLLKDELLDSQALRALGYAPYGAADIGDVTSTTGRITRVEKAQWNREWMSTATRVSALADAALAAGDNAGARAAYFRASNYFRTSNIFAMEKDANAIAVLRAGHAREVVAFRAGAALLESPPDIIQIPYENTTLPGYFFRVSDDGAKRPLMIITNGYDGTVEELYFGNGVAALERGYNVLVFDGPGQGSMLINRGVPIRPDWENVITPVVDFALTLSEVDPKKIVLLGLSFGGYLAPRAATKEHRLAACISDCGPYDLFEVSVSRVPGFLAKALPSGSGLRLAILKRILGGVMNGVTSGWGLRRNLLVHGVETPLEFFAVAPEFSLKGIEDQITCPTFVAYAESDDLSSRAPQLFAALTCEKELIEFKAADGAGSHCEGSARTLFHATIFPWLARVLAD